MRRILCCFLCLTALFAAVAGCSAEASGAAAFADSASAFFRAFNPEQEALKLTIEPPEGEAFSATLAMKDGLFTLETNLPDAPAALQIGKEAAWFSANGAVYELRYADFAKRPASLDEETLNAWQEMLGLFGARILLPGIQAEQSEDALTLRLSYTAEALLPSLAEFGDSVFESDRYLNAILSALNAYARSTGQDELTAEAVRAAWPETREMLLALPKDASLTGAVTASGDSIDGSLALSLSGSAYTLTFSGKDSEGKAEFTAALVAPEGEAASLRFLLDRPGGLFEANASLPVRRDEIRIKGNRIMGILTGEAEIISGGLSLLDIRLSLADTGFRRGRTNGSGQLVIQTPSGRMMNGRMIAVDFDYAPGRFRAALSSDGRTFALKWNRREDGSYSGSFECPRPYFSATLSGKAQKGELYAEANVLSAGNGSATATLDFSAPERRCSLEGSFGESKGSFSFTWDRDGSFETKAEASVWNGKYPVPVSAKVSGYLRRGALSVDYELNHRGKWASGSISAIGAGQNASLLATLNLFRYDSTITLQATQTRKALELRLYTGRSRVTASFTADGRVEIHQQNGDDQINRSLTGGFEDAGGYLLDFAVIHRMDSLPVRSYENHMLLRASIPDDKQISLVLTEENSRSVAGTVTSRGEPKQHFAAALSRVPAEPVELLSGQNPVRLTPELLIKLLGNR